MKRLLFTCFALGLLSCSQVSFESNSSNNNDAGNNPAGCTGAACPAGTFAWYEVGFGICNKPCGNGSQVQVVECRRSTDNVVVADSYCSASKPATTRTCNVQTCSASYAWNTGDFGACDRTCGGGNKVRSVNCQSAAGAIVPDTNCSSASKPEASAACNVDACPPNATYAWDVTPGKCDKSCGGGVATDVVICKKSDGSVASDAMCAATTKPATSRTCNADACPPAPFTYAWEPQTFGSCSKDCGDGLQSRAVACRRSDGVYVGDNFCPAATKPVSTQACNLKSCTTPPRGARKVTQTATVPPAATAVDVVLIIDDSSSMKEDQTKLANRMVGLINDLDTLNIDYQVCVTSTDVGYWKGSPIKWVSPAGSMANEWVMNKNTPNKNAVFVNTINSLGAEWSSDEQGIKSMNYMIRDFRNVGCLRAQSTLATILISDENERSVGGNANLSQAQYKPLEEENKPDTLINFVKASFNTATYTKPFIWNSIIVKPGDNACEASQDASGTPSFPGTLYAELSSKTNGHIGSICDNDYSQNLKYIKDRTVGSLPGLKLECVPTDEPIITFDRAVATSVSRNGDEVKFTPALPEGVKVTATYTCAQ